MDFELTGILRELASEVSLTETQYTHVTHHPQVTKWFIPPEVRTEFWRRYCKQVDIEKDKPHTAMCLAEKIAPSGPIIGRLTLKYQHQANENSPTWEVCNDAFLKHLVMIYQTIIAEEFRVQDPNNCEYVAIILESSEPWEEENPKTGQKYFCVELVVHFPYTKVSVQTQSQLIRPRVIALLRESNALAHLNRQPVGDWEQIVAKITPTDSVLLYGSSSNPTHPKLTLSRVWGLIDDPDTDTYEHTLAETMSVLFHSSVRKEIIDPNIFTAKAEEDKLAQVNETPNETPSDVPLNQSSEVPHYDIRYSPEVPRDTTSSQEYTSDSEYDDDGIDLKYWLPLLLSQDYYDKELLRVNAANRYPAKTIVTPKTFGSGGIFLEDENQLAFIDKLIPMLSFNRWIQEPFWLCIGKALYTADNAGERGLKEWIRYTEKYVGTDVDPLPAHLQPSIESRCRDIYPTFSLGEISKITIGEYAAQDNPERYADWHQHWCLPAMEAALSCLDADVAKALFRVYWNRIIFVPEGQAGGTWYMFRNSRITEDKMEMMLRNLISGDFVNRFEQHRLNLCAQKNDSDDPRFKADAEITISRLSKVIAYLKKDRNENSLVRASRKHFINYEFSKRLNTNGLLTGIIGGVLEVIGPQIVFRAAKLEDYVSMNTELPYNLHYSHDHPLVKECMEWLRQIFVEPELLHYFLKFAASGLEASNIDKIFPIFSGGGNNSKTMLVKLFEATFGAYCTKVDVSVATDKRSDSKAANPQMAATKNTRFVFMDEPEEDAPMNKAMLKVVSGDDSMRWRQLYDNGGVFLATFIMILICNKVPIIPNADKAIKNRVRIFPFLSTWDENAPDDPAEQRELRLFKLDTNFRKRIPALAAAFLWILVDYYPKYALEGLNEPQVVTDYTTNYWHENDLYAQFINDCIREVKTDNKDALGKPILDQNCRETIGNVYDEFKQWFRGSFPGVKIPERNIVKSELSTRWGRPVGNTWPGISIINEENPTGSTFGTLKTRANKEDKEAKGKLEAATVKVDRIGTMNTMNTGNIDAAAPVIMPVKVPTVVL